MTPSSPTTGAQWQDHCLCWHVCPEPPRILTPELIAEIEAETPPEPPIEVRRVRSKDGLILVIGPISEPVS